MPIYKTLADSPQETIDEILDLVSLRNSNETTNKIKPPPEYKEPSEGLLFASLIGSVAPVLLAASCKKIPEVHQVVTPILAKIGFSENSFDILCASMTVLGVAFCGLMVSKALRHDFRKNAFEKTIPQQCDIEIFKIVKENHIQEKFHKYVETAELSLPPEERDEFSDYDFEAHYGFTPE
jgi:hypothetical protein